MRPVPVRFALFGLVLAAASLTAFSPLRGQRASSPELHVTPRLGYDAVLRGGAYGTLFVPSTTLPRRGRTSARAVGLDDGGSIGLALDMALPFDWMEFRLTADRSIGMELVRPPVEVVDRDGERGLGFVPGPEELETGIGVRRWTFGGDLLLFPAPRGWAVRPFASVGGVFHWNRFDDDGSGTGELEGTGGVQLGLIRDPVDGSFRFGTGIDVRVRRWIVRGEVSLVQGSEDRRQEFHTTVGVRIPIR